METLVLSTAARLFEYPQPGYLDFLRHLELESKSVSVEAHDRFFELRGLLERLTFDELRELYTRTFDLTPVCAPYLSVHLFGESSFYRAKLMTGLAELYASKGMHASAELPDHIAVVLESLTRLDPIERRDLTTLCLKPSFAKMHDALERQGNSYALAISALEGLVARSYLDAEVVE